MNFSRWYRNRSKVLYGFDPNIYIIYYNDIDSHNIINSNRYCWNIAHELGHILLEHHKTNEKTRIFRSSLSNQEYDYFEAEADYFAQLILVPHVVLYAFKIKNSSQLKSLCRISAPAANRRFYAYQQWIKNINGNDEYDKPLFHLYYNFIYKKQCNTCNAKILQKNGKYCPICGQKTLQWGDGKMIYEKLNTYDNGKLKECPIYENEETNIAGSRCQICGTYLVNNCTLDDCEYSTTELPSNARYCPICGSESTFYRNGFLKEWNFKEQISNGFMSVPDGIDDELPFS